MVPCRSDLLASFSWHSVLDWSSVFTTRIVELVVDCVVELASTAATIVRLSSGAGLPAASAVSLLELCMLPLLKLYCVFPGETFELALSVLCNFIVHIVL